MSASVKKNFAFSSILTTANLLFPMITYPYVTRVLGVSNIGICNFVDSIINYFVLFSMLGISTIGIREIAASGVDRERRSKVYSSLLCLNGITTIIALIVLIVCIFTIPRFMEYKEMLFIGAFKLFFNFLLIEWFYKGIEDFKYITIRTLFIRVVYTLAVFLFIHNQDDYDVYYMLTTATIVVNAIINRVYARKFVDFSVRGVNIKPYLHSFVILGLYLVVTSMYTTFNVAYLGMVSDTTEVGYYSTAHKLFTIILSIYTAFTGVMMPRMSSLLSEGKMEEFKNYIKKSTSFLFSFSIPIIILSIVYSKDIIRIIAGEGYEGAIVPMQITAPLLFVIGYEQILVVQILTPLKKDKLIFINSLFGAFTGIICNVLLAKPLGAIGSSIVWCVSEIVVLFSAQYFVNKLLKVKFPFLDLLKNTMSYIPAMIVCVIIMLYVSSISLRILLGGFFMAVYFIFIQKWVIKDKAFVALFEKIADKVMNRG